jgi:hypothetical protein
MILLMMEFVGGFVVDLLMAMNINFGENLGEINFEC